MTHQQLDKGNGWLDEGRRWQWVVTGQGWQWMMAMDDGNGW